MHTKHKQLKICVPSMEGSMHLFFFDNSIEIFLVSFLDNLQIRISILIMQSSILNIYMCVRQVIKKNSFVIIYLSLEILGYNYKHHISINMNLILMKKMKNKYAIWIGLSETYN